MIDIKKLIQELNLTVCYMVITTFGILILLIALVLRLGDCE